MSSAIFLGLSLIAAAIGGISGVELSDRTLNGLVFTWIAYVVYDVWTVSK